MSTIKKKRMKKVVKAEIFLPTEDRHEKFSDDMAAVIGKHEDVLRPVEMIAILANCIGSLLVLLPEEHIRSGAALELIQRNIDGGNAQANEAVKGLNMLVGSDTAKA